MNNVDNATANNATLRVFAVSMAFFIGVLCILIYFAVEWERTEPASSYQEKNLKVLKMAQRDDILICIVGSGTAQTVQRALLVENSNADRVVAYSLNQRFVGGIRIYDYLMFDTCEIRILRPSETRGASDMLASIILYGFKSEPPK